MTSDLAESIGKNGKNMIIGVVGGSGAGKTTFINMVMQEIGPDNCMVLHCDDFYRDLSHLDVDARKKTNFDHPDSIDWDIFLKNLLQLKNNEIIKKPSYDFKTHTRIGYNDIHPKPVVFVDGILLLSQLEISTQIDFKIYIHTSSDLRFIRRLQRDVVERDRTMEGVVQRYMDNVRPMHFKFVHKYKKNVDKIVNWDSFDHEEVDLVSQTVKRFLKYRL